MAEVKKVPIKNLVLQHKKMAEDFLGTLVGLGAVPKNFSGILCPKFGSYINVWQFNKNKLVGATIIHKNNVHAMCKKLEESLASYDWMMMKEVANDSVDEPSDAITTG